MLRRKLLLVTNSAILFPLSRTCRASLSQPFLYIGAPSFYVKPDISAFSWSQFFTRQILRVSHPKTRDFLALSFVIQQCKSTANHVEMLKRDQCRRLKNDKFFFTEIYGQCFAPDLTFRRRVAESVISEDERARRRERCAIAPVAHRVEYPGTKSEQLRNDDAGVEILGVGAKTERENRHGGGEKTSAHVPP